MPRAGWVKPESEVRLSDHISIGLLTKTYPPELVDAVVASTGRTQFRHRLLPARVVVYYVMALSLYSQASYEEVMQFLVQGLSWLTHCARAGRCRLRRPSSRVGSAWEWSRCGSCSGATARPLAGSETEGAWYRGWRVMAIDGSCLDVTDTEAKEIAFGRPGSAREGQAGLPQLRLVGLAECGTHAIVAAGTWRRSLPRSETRAGQGRSALLTVVCTAFSFGSKPRLKGQPYSGEFTPISD